MKRLLSILLAITMIAAMLPTAFAGEAEDTRETIMLKLHSGNLEEKNADGSKSDIVHGTNGSAKIADLVAKDGSYSWVADKSANQEVNTTSFSFYENSVIVRSMQYIGEYSTAPWPTSGKKAMLTVKTNIPQEAAGYYKIRLNLGKYSSGGVFAVYADGKYVGDIDTYSASNISNTNYDLSNAVKLPEGDIEISFRARTYRKGTKNPSGMPLAYVYLVPTDEPTVSAVESTIPDTIVKDSTAELSAKVKMGDGTYRAFGYTDAGTQPTADYVTDTLNMVNVTSSDTSVIEVTELLNAQVCDEIGTDQTLDPTTVTYKLTALKAGTSDITVTAYVDGKTQEITKTVTVPAPREIITLNLNSGNLLEKIDENGTTSKFYHNDSEAQADSKNEKNASANIDDLVVVDKTYEWIADKSANHESAATTTSFYGKDNTRSMQYLVEYSKPAWPASGKEAMLTLKTKIPQGAAGYYNVRLGIGKNVNGGVFAVYADGEYVGDIDTYSDPNEPFANYDLSNAVELPEGDVEISFRARKYKKSNLNTAAIIMGEIYLIPVDAPSISEVESEIPTELSEGDMSELSAKVLMGDETYRAFGYTNDGAEPTEGNVVKVTSSAPSVVEVAEVVNADIDEHGNLTQDLDPTAVTYKLAAKKAGSAKITVTAIVDGQEKTTEETITVTGLGADASSDAGTVTLGILTNYADAKSGVTATGYNINGSNQVSVGTPVTAEAKDVDDYKFMYWKVGGTTTKGGTFITADSKLENYVVNTNTSLIAVYEKTNETLKIVEFWNANKQFLSRDDNDDNEIIAPTLPAVTGFELTGNWLIGENEYLDLANIVAGTTRAVAERSDTGNAITGSITVNGEAVTEALTYDNKIERTVEGAKYWTRDGKVVFYGETYTYHMWDATDIKSHTDDIVAVPTVVLDDPASGAYMIEYCVPEGYTKLEAGILFAKSGTPIIGSFSSKAASQSDSRHGQFTAQADTGEIVVRGYLVYEDKDGNKKVIYAELPSAEE